MFALSSVGWLGSVGGYFQPFGYCDYTAMNMGLQREYSFFFFAVLGLKLWAYNLNHSTSSFFVKGVFEIGSLKLLAQAGFELQSS
jgi:hypothetical protein